MNIGIEAVRKRISVRSYSGDDLSAEQAAGLESAFVECLPAPFGSRPRFALIRAEPGSAVAKLGTYGLLSKVPAYVVGAVALGDGAMEDFGYAMEGIVLRATELGLGSCWLGGVFDRGKSARTLGLAEGEVVPAALSVGVPAGARALPDLIVTAAAGSRRRLDHGKLFFGLDAQGEWSELAIGGPWAEILEAVRIAPSASNKQPWRLLLDEARGALHAYLAEDRLYNAALRPVSLQNMDIGIALRHIEAAASSQGWSGRFLRLEDAPSCPRGWEYICTWTVGSRS